MHLSGVILLGLVVTEQGMLVVICISPRSPNFDYTAMTQGARKKASVTQIHLESSSLHSLWAETFAGGYIAGEYIADG
jgi:hypothetical protein